MTVCTKLGKFGIQVQPTQEGLLDSLRQKSPGLDSLQSPTLWECCSLFKALPLLAPWLWSNSILHGPVKQARQGLSCSFHKNEREAAWLVQSPTAGVYMAEALAEDTDLPSAWAESLSLSLLIITERVFLA